MRSHEAKNSAEPGNQIEYARNHYTDQYACGKGKVEGEVFPFNANISRQFTKPAKGPVRTAAQKEEQSHYKDDSSDNHQGLSHHSCLLVPFRFLCFPSALPAR